MTEEKSELKRNTTSLGVELYEELSHLNNELADMHREMAKKNVELKNLNEEKNRFLGMAAHDIRKPLSVISIYSEFLLDELPGVATPEQIEFIQIIREVGRSALSIVNDFLDFSKIEAGKLSLNLERFDISALANDVVRLNRVLAEKKSINIVLHLPDLKFMAVADEQKIRQVLDNLVGNAVKFSPDNTEIRVEVSCRDDSVLISVKDQGPGISEEDQRRMFAPYEQTSVKSIGDYKSSGLGLAIAKKIITAHQGSLWVESETGKGAAFFAEFPIENAELKKG